MEQQVSVFVDCRDVHGHRVSIAAVEVEVDSAEGPVSHHALETHIIDEIVRVTSLVLQDVDIRGDVGTEPESGLPGASVLHGDPAWTIDGNPFLLGVG